jgi:hypothetical protein
MPSSQNTKDSLDRGGRETQQRGQERFFAKLRKIKMNRKIKYFVEMSIQVSSNCSLHDNSLLILLLLLSSFMLGCNLLVPLKLMHCHIQALNIERCQNATKHPQTDGCNRWLAINDETIGTKFFYMNYTNLTSKDCHLWYHLTYLN